MEAPTHSMNALFNQLGLASSDEAINTFISSHKPILDHVSLEKASFWNTSQATFLKQMKDHDADWSEIVDQLDVLLR